MDLQQKMDELGLYGGTKYRLGSWDQADAAAYADLLSGANMHFMDADTWLQQLLEHPELTDPDKTGDTGSPSVVHLTNPADIRATATEIAKNLYGSYLPEDTMNNLIESFNAIEMQSQSGYNALQDSETGGVTTDTPSLDNYVEEQLRKRAPEKVLAHDFGTHMDQMIQTLTTSPGG
jgi:hypothetical protein